MITLDEFSHLIKVHSSNLAAWPSDLQIAGEDFLATSEEARALMKDYLELEQQLDALPVPMFSGLEAKILGQSLPPRTPSLLEQLLEWLLPNSGFTLRLWQPVAAACLPLVFGIVLGNFYSFGVTFESDEMEYWEDELTMLSLNNYSENDF